MTVEEKIFTFINEMGYLDNEHVLGIIFYGSYLTGVNTANSDIDLHIILDNDDPNHLIRGNKIIDGTRIEYFEKPIEDIYQTIDEDYNTQNNASLTIFGKSKIIYAKDDQMIKLQNYAINKFSSPLPSLSENEAKEQVSIINNRMEKLERYAKDNDPFFEHLYHLTIDKIRRFYHNLMGMPRIETSKGFRLYTDEKYRNAFAINLIPEQAFIDMYFDAITNQNLTKIQKYQLLNKIYEYTKRNVYLNPLEHRIPIKSRNEGFNMRVIELEITNYEDSIVIPPTTLKKILMFIKEMSYLENKHCLGAFVYGSSLTGFNTDCSDIDLHVVFDNDEPTRLIRGAKIVEGTKIEYFEKPIQDIYLSIENGYLNQNNACYSLFGKGAIVFDREDKLKELQQYTINRFSTPMPSLNEEDSKEQVSIINNRMEKLEKYAIEDDPKFDHLYHLAIDKIRKFYHKFIGISKIQTSKVYRIYTDEEYRESMYKENPEPQFVEMYLDLITTKCVDRIEKLEMLRQLYNYTTRNINLGDEYRIAIKSRNIKNSTHVEQRSSRVLKKEKKIEICDKTIDN